ncbi:GerW family sporulation protein [Streptomyces sp. NBC_00878]|uniref:GerW family sporulation protein n=1 Tax=Streptomyces sp. NBC_00878 TaxID=2975854 RepID=UPI002255FAEB|nr:spore germination protein GerW family protein [Streptomyces sp. NBC_00878]MCX4907622.1 spore germination protein GerW family protein [Streptomyces sp. NBC_00878]
MPHEEPVEPVKSVEPENSVPPEKSVLPVKPVEPTPVQPTEVVPVDASTVVPADIVADLPAGNSAGVLLEQLAEKLGGSVSVSAVYGEPVTRGGVTIIPVAKVGFGFGAGLGREAGAAQTGEGGGGGGGGGAKPVGFIEIQEGFATYRPIRDPWVYALVPLVAVALGSALPGIIRALRRRN